MIDTNPIITTYFASFVSGTLSGMASIVVCHPIDVLRTKIQVENKSLVSVVNESIHRGGFASLYKGFALPFFGQGIIDSIYNILYIIYYTLYTL